MIYRKCTLLLLLILLPMVGYFLSSSLIVKAEGNYRVKLPLVMRDDFPASRRYVVFTEQNQIIVSRADGQTRWALTADESIYSNPVWSPAGDFIVFEGKKDGVQSLYLATADGSNRFTIASNPSTRFRYAWAPDGKHLIYISPTSSTLVSLDVNRLETTTISEGVSQWGWYSGSNQIFYLKMPATPPNAENDLYTYDFLTEQQYQLTNQLGYVRYFLSPTTLQMAVLYDGDTENERILQVMNYDGSDVLELGRGDFVEYDVEWSPTGRQIAYARFQPNTQALDVNIFIANTDGSGVNQITNAPSWDQKLVWSPTGSELAYYRSISGTPDNEIHLVHNDGSNDRVIANITGAATPAWLRDGRFAIFEDDKLTIVPDNSASFFVNLPTCDVLYGRCSITHWNEMFPDNKALFLFERYPISQSPFSYLVTLDLTYNNAFGQRLESEYDSMNPIISQDNRAVMYERWFYQGPSYPRELVIRDFWQQRVYTLSENGFGGSWAPLGYAP